MRFAARFYRNFLTTREFITYLVLLLGRCLSGILDVLGVLSVGYLGASVAKFISDGNNESQRLNFIGLDLPAVTARSLPLITGAIMLAFILKAVLSIVLTRTMAVKIAEIEARAAKLVSQGALGHGLERSREISKDELSFSVQVGTSAAFTGILNSFASLVAEGSLFMLLCGAFLIFNPIATLGMLIYFFLLAYLIQLFVGKKLSSASSLVARNLIEANRSLGDLSSAFRELFVSGRRDSFFNKIYFARKSAAHNVGQQTYLSGMPRHIVETGLIVGLGVFVFAQTSSGDLSQSATTIGIFLAGGFRIVAAMLPWQNALVNIKIYAPQAEQTWMLLSQKQTSLGVLEATKDVRKAPVAVQIVNVDYRYPNSDRNVFTDISLEIKPGQHAAIIGPSGEGKTTLADLIIGLTEPTSGKVLLDGANSKTRILSEPGLASYVPQSPGLVSGTILNNIALGIDRHEIDWSSIERVLKECRLESFIESLDDGINTFVGSQNEIFSGGQTQRIGLARALYSNPGLLLLDEATSALDAESESAITDSLSKLKGKVTVITIAHRLNSIQNADVVFYIDGGKVAGSGTFEELRRTIPDVARAANLMTLPPSKVIESSQQTQNKGSQASTQ